jgi:hypothetical protein
MGVSNPYYSSRGVMPYDHVVDGSSDRLSSGCSTGGTNARIGDSPIHAATVKAVMTADCSTVSMGATSTSAIGAVEAPALPPVTIQANEGR